MYACMNVYVCKYIPYMYVKCTCMYEIHIHTVV